ncbi:DUF3592 domain-containing protein [Bifidobacterium callitrichos]|uniref:DUF3592 domain-containing protein n=1 Tax=Bifidobacterium callitrichos DSM 23973 TaxID=1437609 RepID=A0A086ZWH4_9BIFI|nr:DUF3592 domain-containing protein [Bifidobacterium callitrichos]KFI50874.1 hypothetical protein BCAL_2153 [Bifidobacterium callitrichos DSM 23973]
MFEGIITFALGLFFLSMMVFAAFDEHRLNRRATATTTGTVLREEIIKGDNGVIEGSHYVIRFEVDGGTFEVTTQNGDHKPGGLMEVDYDPSHPKTARATVDRRDRVDGMLFILIVVFAIPTAIGAWLIVSNIG